MQVDFPPLFMFSFLQAILVKSILQMSLPAAVLHESMKNIGGDYVLTLPYFFPNFFALWVPELKNLGLKTKGLKTKFTLLLLKNQMMSGPEN